jgi:PAS domain S-box-containing protein
MFRGYRLREGAMRGDHPAVSRASSAQRPAGDGPGPSSAGGASALVRPGAILFDRELFETLDAVGLGYFSQDLATGATVWSRGWYQLFGYEPGEVEPGQAGFEARVHPADLAALYAAPLSPFFTSEFRVVLPEGRVRWLRGRNQTVFDDAGRPLQIRGVLVDATREKEAELQLERLAEVASRTANAVVVTDKYGRAEWVNEGFTRLTGYSPGEVIGLRPGELLQGPDTSEETRTLMRRAIAAGEPFEVVLLNYTRAGRQYWVRIEARPTHDREGRHSGYIALEADVTEERVNASRESLAERIAAMLLASESVAVAGERVVRELVRELDVLGAQLWLVEPRAPALVYLAGAAAEAAGQEWLDVSRDLSFRQGEDWVVGVGAPGTAWGTGKTYARTDFWSQDVNGQLSRRAKSAIKAGIRTVCAAPIHGPHGVLGVLEVGGSLRFPGHDRLPSLLDRVCEQIAAFILQDSSRRAFETIFRRSPDALLLLDGDGTVRALNARAMALFGAATGLPVARLLPGAGPLVSAALAGEQADVEPGLVELEAHRADGGRFTAEVSLAATPSSTTQTVIVALRDLTERLRMQDELQRSLAEKVILVQEVHHRVKNNLQIISSMVALQADAIDAVDVQQALMETANRVQSMALVHQHLYSHADLSRIDFSEYARSLCMALRASLDPEARFEFEGDAVDLAIDRAVPCGLIVNELVTNALKYGRSPDGLCRLRIGVERQDGGLAFVVADQGPGLAETTASVPRAGGASIGHRLIQALVRQLRATMTITMRGGTEVRVEVPDAAERRAGRGR